MVAIDYRIVRSGGEVRWLSCEGLAEVDETGELLRLRGTAQDITGRRRVEDRSHAGCPRGPDATHRGVANGMTNKPL